MNKIDFNFQDINFCGVENLFILTRGTKQGVYNSKGKKILTTKYEELTINDEYIYTKIGKEEKYFNLKGEEIDKSTIKEDKNNDDESTVANSAEYVNPTLIPKEKNGKWGFVDKNSNLKVDYIYDEVTQVNKYGFAGVKKNGKWGSIDEKGNVVQEPKYNLDKLDDIDFIGKYYKIIYDYKSTFYTDDNE